jgi:hypothetical protein
MHEKHQYGTLSESPTDESEDDWQGEIWDMDRLEKYQQGKPGKCIVLLDEFVLDVTSYLGDHVCGFIFHPHASEYSLFANSQEGQHSSESFRLRERDSNGPLETLTGLSMEDSTNIPELPIRQCEN